MTLSLSLSHRFDGFALDLALDAGPGITALFGRRAEIIVAAVWRSRRFLAAAVWRCYRKA